MVVLKDVDICFTDLIGCGKLQELLEIIVTALREQEEVIQPLQSVVDTLRHDGQNMREQIKSVFERLDSHHAVYFEGHAVTGDTEPLAAIEPETARGDTEMQFTPRMSPEQYQAMNTRMNQYEALLKHLQVQNQELHRSRAEFEQKLKEEHERQVKDLVATIQEDSEKIMQHISSLNNGLQHDELTLKAKTREDVSIEEQHILQDHTDMLGIQQDVCDLSYKLNEVIESLGKIGVMNDGYRFLSAGTSLGNDQSIQTSPALQRTPRFNDQEIANRVLHLDARLDQGLDLDERMCVKTSSLPFWSPSREVSMEMDERADSLASDLVNAPRESLQGLHKRWVTYITLLAAQNNIIARLDADIIGIFTCSEVLTLGQIRADLKRRYPENIIQLIDTGGVPLDTKFDGTVLSTDADFAQIPVEDQGVTYMIC